MSVDLYALIPALEFEGEKTNPIIEITLPFPTVEILEQSTLDVNLPTISFAGNAEGTYCSLLATYPAIEIDAIANISATFLLTLPEMAVGMSTGGSIDLITELLDINFTGITGTSSNLIFTIPEYDSLFVGGLEYYSELTNYQFSGSGLVGTTGRLFGQLGYIVPEFTAAVENIGSLLVTAPSLVVSIESISHVLGSLIASEPKMFASFSALVGETWTLNVLLPELAVEFSAYTNIDADLYATMSLWEPFFEASHPGRFDTTTSVQLGNIVLKYSRPS